MDREDVDHRDVHLCQGKNGNRQKPLRKKKRFLYCKPLDREVDWLYG